MKNVLLIFLLLFHLVPMTPSCFKKCTDLKTLLKMIAKLFLSLYPWSRSGDLAQWLNSNPEVLGSNLGCSIA